MTQRLDSALAARGLARSRTYAASLIAAGAVAVDGAVITRPAHPVSESHRIEVRATDDFVSRAGAKLLAALDAFEVPVAGRVAVDAGASTGGFTQVLRRRGADPVIAVDVGHDQLAPAVAADPRVIRLDGVNVRTLTASALREMSGITAAPDLITADLSFISLRTVMPALIALAAPGADLVLLVKPQFEVGRAAIGSGVVTDPRRRANAIAGVLGEAWRHGAGTLGVIRSPVTGTHGNVEFLVHLGAGRGRGPTEWEPVVTEVAGAR